MRLQSFVEQQELTEGTFLFEQQVNRELDECTYAEWCTILEETKDPWWMSKGQKFQQDYIKNNPKSDTARAIKKFLATKDTPTKSDDDTKTSSSDEDAPDPKRYNEPLSKHPTLKKAMTAEVNNLVKDLGVARDELVNAIKEKSVFRAVKAVGLGGGKVALDGLKTVDSAVNFAADKVAATQMVQGLQKGTVKVDEFLNKYPKLKTVGGVAIAGFLTYQWLQMSFSGNLDSDYDLSNIPEAIAGNIGFTEVLATPAGIKGLGLLAAGIATGGMTTLWAGGRKGMMMAAAYTGAKKAGNSKLANNIFGKMRQYIGGDGGKADDKDREPDETGVKEGRNYKKEYENYHSRPDQKKRRAQRNNARNAIKTKYKKSKVLDETDLDDMDVHHKDGDTANNDISNLSVTTIRYNRREPRLRERK
jgi:hypothetical protein|tara:strand:+ start:2103 stop:3356 length:1254 start_codon:yes stop_codon:yes gene_type:complete